jgi:hypothetical protein
MCGFAPGATVAISVDGQSVGNQTADGNGCVAVTIKPSAGAAMASVNGFPLAAVALPEAVVHILGQATGTSKQITVNGVTVNGVCGSNSAIGVGPNTQGGTLTQTDLFTVNCAAAPVSTPTTGTGGLAVTGANIIRFGGAALLLIAFGAVLVFADRRRGRARD